MSKVVIAGTFDGLHLGHQELFNVVKDLSSDIKVFVNSDELILNRKPNLKLLFKENERVSQISKMYPTFSIDIVNSTDEIKQFLSEHNSTLWHGDDYDINSLSDLYGVDKYWWKKNGIKLCFTPRTSNMSSSKLREQKQVIVLGHYYGGCSLVAGILEKLGVDMGDYRESKHKFDGKDILNYECLGSIDISEKLRVQSGDKTLSAVNVNSWKKITDTSCIDEYIKKRNTSSVWGIKDQKLVPFINLVIEKLPNPYIIFVSRGKENTVRDMSNLRIDSHKSADDVYNEYELIFSYLRKILNKYPILEVDASGDNDSIDRVYKIANFLGLTVTDESINFFNNYLK